MELKRAITIDNILNKKYKTFGFTGKWFDAFGKPETTGVWFVWGNSGNGKTSFILQLIKCLAQFDKVLFNSLEEGTKLTLRKGVERTGLGEVSKKVSVVTDNKNELIARLKKHKSHNIVLIDSFQHFQLSYREYLEFKNMFHKKLIIFISQAKGRDPKGDAALSIQYDADLKIWVEGFRAFSKGRYFGTDEYYTIYNERAIKYWGQ